MALVSGCKNSNLFWFISQVSEVRNGHYRSPEYNTYFHFKLDFLANQITWLLFLSARKKNHKLGRGHLDLAFCQVSLNSVRQFQRRSRKCLSQSEVGTAFILVCLKWRTSRCNVAPRLAFNVNSPPPLFCFSVWPEKQKRSRGRWDLYLCQVSINSV